eukprot:2507898-Pleurochrysis_carterae.AAC.3
MGSTVTPTELSKESFYLIQFDQTKTADLHGELAKNFYLNVLNFKEMAARLAFKFEGWVNRKNKRVCLNFDYNNTNDMVYLHRLFNPPWQFRLIPGTNGRVPCHSAANRACTERAAEQDAAAAPAGVDTRFYTGVKYMDGQVEKVQRWFYEEPEAIATDARSAV